MQIIYGEVKMSDGQVVQGERVFDPREPQGGPLTRLAGKHHSPMVIRKFTRWGPPIYVALITDDNLDSLDQKVVEFVYKACEVPIPGFESKGWEWPSGIQAQRNLAGALTNHLVHEYGKVEGAAVVLYADKMLVSSLFGDFMNHGWCRLELFQYLNLLTQI